MTGGVNLSAGLPMGDFADGVNLGIGAGLEFNYFVTDELALGIEAGYLTFGTEIDDYSVNMIPISVKGEYFFSDDDFRPYAGLGVGFFLVSSVLDGESILDQNGLGISPRVGFEYELNRDLALNFNVQYNYLLNEYEETVEAFGVSVTTTSPATPYLGFNVGIRYTLDD